MNNHIVLTTYVDDVSVFFFFTKFNGKRFSYICKVYLNLLLIFGHFVNQEKKTPNNIFKRSRITTLILQVYNRYHS